MNGKDWLGRRVRVFAGHDTARKYHPMAEGDVIAYIDGPSICLRHSDGSRSTWPISLPVDVLGPAIEETTVPTPMTTKTLGQALTDLLHEYGVEGDIVSLRGGPKWLEVTTYAVDEDGKRFVLDGTDDVATVRGVLPLDA